MNITIKRATLGLAALAIAAFAPAAPFSVRFGHDAKITVDRSGNAPTLTVRYSGAAATLVELRINGLSLATKSVTPVKDAGELTFSLALAELKEGDNNVEVRLFDKTGTLLGTNKSVIKAEAAPEGPVSLIAPKNGGTVQGAVEMKIGFGRELKSVFVSFFVDSDFKSMTNFPPYTWTWDSTTATNGWHELEVWAVDDSTQTFKSRKTRVFVNNPGGRTERPGLGMGATGSPSSEPGASKGTRMTGAPVQPDLTLTAPVAPRTPLAPRTVVVPRSAPVVVPTPKVKAPVAQPKAPIELIASDNGTPGRDISGTKGMKVAPTANPIALGNQELRPTGTRVARVVAPVPARPSNPVRTAPLAPALPRLSVTRGTRLENVTSFSVLLNNRYVEFDVAPRVDEGVPMTPFRHLIEKAGGNVDWANATKTVSALADGQSITVRIGDSTAQVGSLSVRLDHTPYLEKGRTIVPLSFLRDVLKVDIQFDPATNHVLITSIKK